MVTRLPEWPELLDAEIEAARRRRFRWGAHDCALWAARVVWTMTGVDLAADYRGRYSDAAGAEQEIAAHGYADLEELATAALGQARPGRFASRGDVVLVQQETGPALGICTGRTAAVPGRDGLVFFDPPRWVKAWRV